MNSRRFLVISAIGVSGFLAIGSSAGSEQWLPETKLLASDPNALDSFGHDVALGAEVLVVGDPFDSQQAADAGAAYVFVRDTDDGWTEIAKLMASDGEEGDFFGTWVTISGNTVAGAAPDENDNAGAVYVFEEEGGVWSEVVKLTALDPPSQGWGSDVALDGDRLVVGAALDNNEHGPNAGSVYIFERDVGGPGNWGPVAKLLTSDGFSEDRFGHSVALAGDTLVGGAFKDAAVGSVGPGAAYVFERETDGEWVEVAKLSPEDGDFSDWFGYSVALHGDTIAVGAPGDDDQDNASGAIYVYERDAGVPGGWGEVRKLVASDPFSGVELGWSVSAHGDVIAGGSTSESGYVFQRNAGGPAHWNEVEKLVAPDATDLKSFGQTVAIHGDTVTVGAKSDNDAAFSAGSAYVFARADLTLRVAGTCPGTVDLGLAAATPDNPVAFLRATSPGTSEVPAGPCAGTPLDLDDPSLLGVVTAGPDGRITAERTLPSNACGRWVQAVDLASCRTSQAVVLP